MRKVKLCIIAMLLLVTGFSHAQWLWNIDELKSVKKEINTPEYRGAYEALIKEAEAALLIEPYTVTSKEYTPPSGDKRDYVSLSRYWWKDSTKVDGMPYVHRDGLSNPELEKYDRNKLGDMCGTVNTLALAYFYSDDERYAAKAKDILYTWFLDEDTKMNPNLNYSQFVPGRNDSKGAAVGLIDSYSFVEMLSSIELLTGSVSFTTEDKKGIQEWFGHLSQWFQTSEQGIKEAAARNNHSTSYDAQLVAFLVFAGNEDRAKEIIEEFPGKRIFPQIKPDGTQPEELRRTLAYHYSLYNLEHMFDLFVIADKLGIDIYRSNLSDERNFGNATDYLASFLGKELDEWPYQQISGWSDTQDKLCNLLYKIVDLDPSREDYLGLYKKYAKDSGNTRLYLLYGRK